MMRFLSLSDSLTLILNSLIIVLACNMSACGPTLTDLQTREQQIKSTQSRVRSLERAEMSAKRYHQRLTAKTGKVLALSTQNLSRSVQAMLPYTYLGKELNRKYLGGQITITKMTDFKLLPGNRAQFYLHFDGRKIKTRNVPAIAKGQVNSLKAAIRSGKVRVEVNGFVHHGQHKLVLKGRATHVKFKKNNTGSNQSRFLDAINRKIFNRQKKIPLPQGLKGKINSLTTPKYLVFVGE